MSLTRPRKSKNSWKFFAPPPMKLIAFMLAAPYTTSCTQYCVCDACICMYTVADMESTDEWQERTYLAGVIELLAIAVGYKDVHLFHNRLVVVKCPLN